MSNKQSMQQVIQYAKNAGFSGQDLVTACAIASCESSLNADDENYNPPIEDSIGLWQINVLAWKTSNKQSLFDPQTNANEAYFIYTRRGGAFTDWTTYNNGCYLTRIPDVMAAMALGNIIPDYGKGGYTPTQPNTGTNQQDNTNPLVPPNGFPGATFAEMLIAFGILVIITLMLPRRYAVYYPFFVLGAYGAAHTTVVQRVLKNVFGYDTGSNTP